jgi:hypothetical protein
MGERSGEIAVARNGPTPLPGTSVQNSRIGRLMLRAGQTLSQAR